MKDGLENSFKEALNNFELPYDANAWDALNQKLSPKRWYQSTSVKWSAALVVAIGLALGALGGGPVQLGAAVAAGGAVAGPADGACGHGVAVCAVGLGTRLFGGRSAPIGRGGQLGSGPLDRVGAHQMAVAQTRHRLGLGGGFCGQCGAVFAHLVCGGGALCHGDHRGRDAGVWRTALAHERLCRFADALARVGLCFGRLLGQATSI